MAQISASPLCLSNSCVLPKLVEVELCPMWSCWEWGCYGPSSLPVQWGFYVRPGLHYVHNLFWPRPQFSPFKLFLCSQCQSSTQVYPRSSSFSIQPRCAPAEVYLRLASTLRWPELYMLVSPCSACHRPVVALSFGPLKLFLCPSWSKWRGFLGWGNTFSFTAPSQGLRFCPNSFIVLFHSTWLYGDPLTKDPILAALVVWDLLPVFSRYFVRIVPPVDVFFDAFGRRWASHPSFLPSWSLFCSPIWMLINFSWTTGLLMNN